MGGRAIACLNARDRNVLGFRRDLLTAAAYGVDDFLFVYGDRPESGSRSDDLTVRSMIAEAREFATGRRAGVRPFTIGVTSTLRTLPAWKHDADRLFTQVSFSVDRLTEWRSTIEFDGPVYAGVMVRRQRGDGPEAHRRVRPARRAGRRHRRSSSATPTPESSWRATSSLQIRESGAFDGVHLVPVGRYRDVARRLEPLL